MMNVLLSVANGALQYHRGKQTGLAGLAGIALALLIAYQWDHILPVLDALGIVDFLNNHGLIYEGEPGLTGFVLFTIAYRAALAFIIVGFLFLVIAMAIAIFTSSKAGFTILYSFIAIPIIPFMFIWMMYDHLKTPKKEKEERIKASIETNEKKMKPISQIIHESSAEISEEQAINRLNRLPTIGDDIFLLGVTHDDEYFVLFPKPFGMESGSYPSRTFAVKRYEIEKFKVNKWENNSPDVWKKLILTPKDNHWQKAIWAMEPNEFKAIYQTEHQDFLNEFNTYKSKQFYKEYVEFVQEMYFKTKSNLLKLISAEDDGEKFEELVNRVTKYNASNEDVVRFMYESQKGVNSADGE